MNKQMKSKQKKTSYIYLQISDAWPIEELCKHVSLFTKAFIRSAIYPGGVGDNHLLALGEHPPVPRPGAQK